MKPYYSDDLVTIYHGDALEALDGGLGFPPPSVLVTDPDFVAAGGSSNGRTSAHSSQYFLFWLKAAAERIRAAMDPAARGFVFSDWRTVGLVRDAFTEPGTRVTAGAWSCKQALAWDRDGIGMGAPFRNSYEMIAVVAGPKASWSHMPRNIPTLVRYPWPYGQSKYHGAEKPVGLVRRLCKWAAPTGEERVLDPFMGSGTTLVAAKELGLHAVGIELEEHHCETAAERLHQSVLDLGAA